jgi:hypothetical protein
MCVDWIFPLKLPNVQSAGQVREVSPLSQKPFPHMAPGVKAVAVVETGLQPARFVPSNARAPMIKEKESIRGYFISSSWVHCSTS